MMKPVSEILAEKKAQYKLCVEAGHLYMMTRGKGGRLFNEEQQWKFFEECMKEVVHLPYRQLLEMIDRLHKDANTLQSQKNILTVLKHHVNHAMNN